MTEIGMIRQVREKHVSRGHNAPSKKGRGSVPKFFGTAYLLSNGLAYTNQI